MAIRPRRRGNFSIALTLILLDPAFASGAPLIPLDAYSPLTCEDALDAFGQASREVVAGREIDPLRRAMQLVHRHAPETPMVLKENPASLHSFAQEWEALCDRLARSPELLPDAQWALIRGFQEKWNLSNQTLFAILQAYRSFGKFAPHLQMLVTPADLQEARVLQEKYELFFDLFPALRERADYYAENVSRKSVPEMAAELARADPLMDEVRVRKEISALHLRIEERLAQDPLTGSPRQALNTALLSLTGKSLPSHIVTRLEGLEHGHQQGLSNLALANALGMTRQQVDFYLHYSHLVNRSVDWNRVVRTEKGDISEEQHLSQLLSQNRPPTYAEIADLLNQARANHTGRTLLPSDGEFRTVSAVAHKARSLDPTPAKARTGDLSLPPYGQVKSDGKLCAPEALLLIRARQLSDTSYKAIAQELGVTEATVREFEAKWSSDMQTGLPQPLRRFLEQSPPATTSVTPNSPLPLNGAKEGSPDKPVWLTVRPPPPSIDPLFDAFNQNYHGLNTWSITRANLFSTQVVDGIATHLNQQGKAEWSHFLDGLSLTTGSDARANQETSRRTYNRYRMYLVLEKGIELYNQNPANLVKLNKNDLATPEGMRTAVSALTGQTIAAPRITEVNWGKVQTPDQEHSDFKRFDENFAALDEWGITTPDSFRARVLEGLMTHCSADSKNEWNRFTAGVSPSTGNMSRLSQDDRKRSYNRYRLYLLIGKAVELYNQNPQNAVKLNKNDLTTPDGMRAVVSALTGQSVLASKVNLVDWENLRRPEEADATFDQFDQNFDAVNAWSVRSPSTFKRKVLDGSATHFTEEGRSAWSGFTQGISLSIGREAATDREGVQQRTNDRYRFYFVLQKAIELYNQNPANEVKLSPTELATPEGIRNVALKLTGKPIGTMDWENLQAPKTKDPNFDPFNQNYHALDAWSITTASAFQAKVIDGLSTHFNPEGKTEWDQFAQGLNPKTGEASRRNEKPRSTNSRYRMYRLLEKAIELYNQNPANEAKLPKSDLTSEEGLRRVVTNLTGNTIEAPKSNAIDWFRLNAPKSEDAIFSQFEQNYDALDNWSITQPHLFKAGVIDGLAFRLGPQGKAEWSTFTKGVSPTLGAKARLKTANLSRTNHRYRMYRLLEKAIELYNQNPNNTTKLTASELATPDGIRHIISELTGNPI